MKNVFVKRSAVMPNDSREKPKKYVNVTFCRGEIINDEYCDFLEAENAELKKKHNEAIKKIEKEIKGK